MDPTSVIGLENDITSSKKEKKTIIPFLTTDYKKNIINKILIFTNKDFKSVSLYFKYNFGLNYK